MTSPFASTALQDDPDAGPQREAEPRHLGLISSGMADEPPVDALADDGAEADRWRDELDRREAEAA